MLFHRDFRQLVQRQLFADVRMLSAYATGSMLWLLMLLERRLQVDVRLFCHVCTLREEFAGLGATDRALFSHRVRNLLRFRMLTIDDFLVALARVIGSSLVDKELLNLLLAMLILRVHIDRRAERVNFGITSLLRATPTILPFLSRFLSLTFIKFLLIFNCV